MAKRESGLRDHFPRFQISPKKQVDYLPVSGLACFYPEASEPLSLEALKDRTRIAIITAPRPQLSLKPGGSVLDRVCLALSHFQSPVSV